MTYKSLMHFKDDLAKHKELIAIDSPVSTVLEMTEIQRRLIQSNGEAAYIEKPIKKDGHLSSIPALINLFGSKKRIAMGMGMGYIEHEHEILSRMRSLGEILSCLRQPAPPKNMRDVMDMWPLFKKVLNMRPHVQQKKPLCREIVISGSDVDLSILPIQTCWPNEPAPLITWPLVITKDENDITNIGIYRMQVLEKNRLIVRWLKHRGGAIHYQKWLQRRANEPFPIAVTIGADPSLLLASVMPIPETMSEYQIAGLLSGKRPDITPCLSVPHHIPSSAEIVLEGWIHPEDSSIEGPYGDHTGYYNAQETFPVMTVTHITMKQSPIYLTTYTSRPTDEPSVLGSMMNEILIPIIQKQFPEIQDCYLPEEACSYRMAIISIKKSFPGHGRQIMMGFWSFLRQFMYTKYVIVVDDDIDVRSWSDVIWAISTRMDPSRDTIILDRMPIDYLDFASIDESLGGKMGLDATNKIPPETSRSWGEKMQMPKDIVHAIDEKFPFLKKTS